MKKIECGLQTLLSLRREIDAQLDNLAQEVVAGETDIEYIERKKAALLRSVDTRFSQLYFDLRRKDDTPKTQFEQFKLEISECTDPMELQGFIHGLEVAAFMWCSSNLPGEAWGGEDGHPTVSLSGMKEFLLSETPNKKSL